MGLVWNTNMAAVSLFWNTNMAAVTSFEYALEHLQQHPRVIADLTLVHPMYIVSMKFKDVEVLKILTKKNVILRNTYEEKRNIIKP